MSGRGASSPYVHAAAPDTQPDEDAGRNAIAGHYDDVGMSAAPDGRTFKRKRGTHMSAA